MTNPAKVTNIVIEKRTYRLFPQFFQLIYMFYFCIIAPIFILFAETK